MPLRGARLSLEIGGYYYRGWFALCKLAKYDVMLGKSWMGEVPHHVDLSRNILWLGQDTPGSQFKYKLTGLRKDTGWQEWQGLACSTAEQPSRGTTVRRNRPCKPGLTNSHSVHSDRVTGRAPTQVEEKRCSRSAQSIIST